MKSIKIIRKAFFLAVILSPLLQAMQNRDAKFMELVPVKKLVFRGQKPVLIGGGTLVVPVRQKEEGFQKVVAIGSFVTSLNDLEEWKNLKTVAEKFYPDDKRVWAVCERDLFSYIHERSKYSDGKDAFGRACEVFKIIAEIISVSKETIKDVLKNEEMQQDAQKAFAKRFCDYIEDALRDISSKRSPSDVYDIETLAKRNFKLWLDRWEERYRLNKMHQKAVKSIRSLSNNVALGEILTFAFIRAEDYQEIRSWAMKNKIHKVREEAKLTEAAISKLGFQQAEAWQLNPKLEIKIAEIIVQNYLNFSSKKQNFNNAELIEKVKNETTAHEFVERIRRLPGKYADAPDQFDALFKALNDDTELPFSQYASPSENFSEHEAEMLVVDNPVGQSDAHKIEAFTKYCLTSFDKSFADVAGWKNLLPHEVLVAYMKNRVSVLFANNATVSWTFKNFLSVIFALHRYAFIIMADEELSQEKREQIIKAVGTLRTKFLKDCLTIYRRDPESLKLYVENCLAQDLNNELGGFLGVAESLGAELEFGQEASVYHQDYLFGRAESSHNDPLFGIVGNIPQEISDLLPKDLEFYQMIVGAQAGDTCFYQAVINAKALEELINEKVAVTGKAIRDRAATYEELVKEACKKEIDDAKNQQKFFVEHGPKQKLVSQYPWENDVELFEDKNYSGRDTFNEALKLAVDNLREKNEPGVVTIICIYNHPGNADYNHAFVLSFVKLKENDPVRLLYMESNNLYLEETGKAGSWWLNFLNVFPAHLKHIIDIVRPLDMSVESPSMQEEKA